MGRIPILGYVFIQPDGRTMSRRQRPGAAWLAGRFQFQGRPPLLHATRTSAHRRRRVEARPTGTSRKRFSVVYQPASATARATRPRSALGTRGVGKVLAMVDPSEAGR